MRNTAERTIARTSATTVAHHMPFIPNIMGSTITAVHLNRNVRRKEMVAETPPSLSAVKKDDAKILNPEKRNVSANILKAFTVSSYKTLS